VRTIPYLAAGILLAVALTGSRLQAQSLESFGLGATVGLSNSVDHEFRLQNFDTHDANLWVQYQLEEDVLLRGTFGSMKVRGHNAGQPGVVFGNIVTLPDLPDRIDYATLSVAYEFRSSGWTTGLFAGVGGYQIRPEPAAAGFAAYRDDRETVWGLHVGVDSDFQIWRRLSGVGRITYHVPQTKPHRQILTANVGLLYRF
jgi:hypothetical protein